MGWRRVCASQIIISRFFWYNPEHFWHLCSQGNRISIVQSAGEYLLELQKERERLRERSRELEPMVFGNVKEAEGSSLVKVEAKISSLASPPSWSFDSVISVLRRLKQTKPEAVTITARHSGRNFAVEVGFEAEASAVLDYLLFTRLNWYDLSDQTLVYAC